MRQGDSGPGAWFNAHPAGTAAVQALLFAIAFGVLRALTSHDSAGGYVVRAAIAGVIFGLLMWAINARRRRTDRV